MASATELQGRGLKGLRRSEQSVDVSATGYHSLASVILCETREILPNALGFKRSGIPIAKGSNRATEVVPSDTQTRTSDHEYGGIRPCDSEYTN